MLLKLVVKIMKFDSDYLATCYGDFSSFVPISTNENKPYSSAIKI